MTHPQRDSVQPAFARADVPARASVHAGGVDTTYLRAGRGEPLVLVTDDVESGATHLAVRQLAERYLVLAAAPAVRGSAALSEWLRQFQEGLGLTDAHVLLHASVVVSLLA